MFSQTDFTHMERALALASKGMYTTTPNPRVGCVLVKNGEVIGTGFTQPAGQDHAEVRALKDARSRGKDPRGATAYVTLEPCSHFGRTPPCRLEVQIAAAHERTRHTYGRERLQADLRDHGVRVGLHRIRRIRSKLGHRCKQKRKFRNTTDSKHDLPVVPNVLERNFDMRAPNQAWVSDISVPQQAA